MHVCLLLCNMEKAILCLRNTFTSSKLNCLLVKRVGALLRQLHICCGFCHCSPQVFANQFSCQQNGRLLWKDNSSSTAEGVGGDHCCIVYIMPAGYLRACFALCQGFWPFHWCSGYCRLGVRPAVPISAMGTCASCTLELCSSCPHMNSSSKMSHN